jgi:hypothetical protein
MSQAIFVVPPDSAVEMLPHRFGYHHSTESTATASEFPIVTRVIVIIIEIRVLSGICPKSDGALVSIPVIDASRKCSIVDDEFAYTTDKKRVLGNKEKDV